MYNAFYQLGQCFVGLMGSANLPKSLFSKRDFEWLLLKKFTGLLASNAFLLGEGGQVD